MTPLEEYLITRMPLEELPGIIPVIPELEERITLRLPHGYDKRGMVSAEEWAAMRLEGKTYEDLQELRSERQAAFSAKQRDEQTKLMSMYEAQGKAMARDEQLLTGSHWKYTELTLPK